MARSSASVTACGSVADAPMPSTNFDAFRTLIASRRPTFICDASNGESRPGRAIAARQRTASEPNFSRISDGTIALPLDFDIFLRSGSTTKPEIIERAQGSVPFSKCARTTRENNQVRMISSACVFRSIGRSSSRGSSGWSYSSSPSSRTGYQTGNGTPKNRWRETSQSPFRPSTQLVYRCLMCSGIQPSSLPRSTNSAFNSSERPPLVMYHWRVETIAGGVHGLAGQLAVQLGPGLGRGQPLGGLAEQPAVAADHGPDRQLQLTPPLHVGQVAERAAHRDTGTLVRLGRLVREHRELDAEQRRLHGLAEQTGVPLVVRVRDQRDAGRDQLRPGGVDVDLAVRRVERDPVEETRVVPRLQLGLRDRGLERDVPQRGRLGEVRLTAGEVAQEAALRGAPRVLGDRRVEVRPVDAQADPAPHRLERLLVDVGQLAAQLDEVLPADRDLLLRVRLLRRRERGVVRQ